MLKLEKKALYGWTLVVLLVTLVTTQTAFAREFSPKKVYKEQSGSVVFIFCTNGGDTGMAGTGSIIREDGLVITNAHVIYDDANNGLFKNTFVYLKPNKVVGDMSKDLSLGYSAKVLYYQKDMDLALLQIEDADKKLPVIEFANPDEIDIGEDVIAIGHPEQGGLWTLTTGTISAVKANFEGVKGKNVFQTEASVNKGNSGGPLLDKRGYMVGVNSNIARKGSSGIAITDINFSIKASVTKAWLAEKGYNFSYGTIALEEIEQVKIQEPVKEKVVPEKELESEPKQEVIKEIEEEISPVEKKPEGKILTKKRPYSMEKFIKQWSAKIEAEMEDVMDEMKGAIQKKKSQGIFDEF